MFKTFVSLLSGQSRTYFSLFKPIVWTWSHWVWITS